MAKKGRRRFSVSEKVAILKEHFVEGKKVSEVCEAHKLNPTVFYDWQRQLFENAASVFEGDAKKEQSRLQQQNENLKSRLQQRDEVLAELMQEHVALKKSLGED